MFGSGLEAMDMPPLALVVGSPMSICESIDSVLAVLGVKRWCAFIR
jgi:hypothetical protein